jgi:phage terminase large subunit-like protein
MATTMTSEDQFCKRSADEWRELQQTLIPGYDPYATAGDGDWFDSDSANFICNFFRTCLTFVEGEKAGQRFIPEPWQEAGLGAAFGWKRGDGTRRYREVFDYEPRKQGKTPKCAGIALFGLLLDDEMGAQVYSAAAEREQAALIYRWAAGMLVREPELNSKVKVYRTFKSIEHPATGNIYKALSSDADTKHGLNVHMAIVDEVHAHRNRELIDVLRTATGSRLQPLIWYITTADYDRESICNELYDYAANVRDGVFDNHAFLPIIYEASADDDWTDPDTWAKANPNLGVSVRREYLEAECQRAKDDPAYENTFKRLHLNVRTQQDVRWMPLHKWDECAGEVDEGALAGELCFAGLDLASREDIAGYCLIFPPNEDREQYVVVPRLFVPGDTAEAREIKTGIPYSTWIRDGYMIGTPGDRCDYDAIQQSILDDGSKFDLQAIAADRWNLEATRQRLGDLGVDIFEHGQGFRDMSEPMKELMSLVQSGLLNHGGHPVLRWAAGNVSAKTNEADSIKPDKKKSSEKIDPIVMLIMALNMSMVTDRESADPTIEIW